MVVGVKDTCYPTFLIYPSLYEERGDVYKWEEIEGIIETQVVSIMKELCLKDDLGLDSKEEYNKLEAVYNIVDYLFTLKAAVMETYVCGEDLDGNSIKERFKYDCVRETLSCKYNLGGLFDQLADTIKIPSGRLGIGYMQINGNTCNNIFKVHKTN